MTASMAPVFDSRFQLPPLPVAPVASTDAATSASVARASAATNP